MSNVVSDKIVIENEVEMTRDEILENISKEYSVDEVLVGDVWLVLDDKSDKNKLGYFLQVESKELNDGTYSDDIFCIYGYKNILDEDGNVTSDYSTTSIYFEFHRDEFTSLRNKV